MEKKCDERDESRETKSVRKWLFIWAWKLISIFRQLILRPLFESLSTWVVTKKSKLNTDAAYNNLEFSPTGCQRVTLRIRIFTIQKKINQRTYKE